MATSYNGWHASRNPDDFGGLAVLKVGTETFPPGVRAGDVHTVLSYVATQLDARVEKVAFPGGHPADDWGYNYRQNRNASNLSCHASGTAFDFNATLHPNGRRGTFTAAQVREIRKILAEVDGVVNWGGDFSGTPDEMHFEIDGTASQVAVVANKIKRGLIGPKTSTPTTNDPEEDDMSMQVLIGCTKESSVWLVAPAPTPGGKPTFRQITPTAMKVLELKCGVTKGIVDSEAAMRNAFELP